MKSVLYLRQNPKGLLCGTAGLYGIITLVYTEWYVPIIIP